MDAIVLYMGKKKWKSGMGKKIVTWIGIFVVIIALLVGFYFIYYKPAIQEKEQLLHRFSEFNMQYQEKKAQGYDVFEARVFARKAKHAFNRKDYKTANNVLDNAFDALEKAEKILIIPEAVKEEARRKLSSVKVSAWYQSITDYRGFDRSMDDVITHLKETRTEFVFRAFWRYLVIPEKCSDLSSPTQQQRCEAAGFSYSDLRESIIKIKSENPEIIISVGIPTERINTFEKDPITADEFDEEETWAMALDPEEHGINITKIEFQEGRARLLGFIPSDDPYDRRKAVAYYPDITNPKFQRLQLDWAKKQIDCGVDAIWVDMLFAQARMFKEITKDSNHPAVKEAYDAALKVVNEIHNYGLSKGKYIYVGGWTNCLYVNPSFPPPDFDFVVVMVWEDEILNKSLFEEKWDTSLPLIKEKMGNDILILTFMDEAAVKWEDQPLGIFSQHLTEEEQKEFLKTTDKFFLEKKEELGLPIVFIYPLHGGWMGSDAKVLSYAKYKVYDSLAPEFGTYETIKELAESKK